MSTDGDTADGNPDPFDSAWIILERRCRCDGHGGAEYQRIRAAWRKLVGLHAALQFIAAEASRPTLTPDAKDGAS